MPLNLPQIADLLRPIANDQAEQMRREPETEAPETPTSSDQAPKQEE